MCRGWELKSTRSKKYRQSNITTARIVTMAIRLFEITTSLGGLFSNSVADPYPKTTLSCDWRCCHASEDARYSVPSCHRQNCHGNMQLAGEGFRSPQLPKVQGLHMHFGTYWDHRVFCCYCATIPAVVANIPVIAFVSLPLLQLLLL